jgi:hypothetical protein
MTEQREGIIRLSPEGSWRRRAERGVGMTEQREGIIRLRPEGHGGAERSEVSA